MLMSEDSLGSFHKSPSHPGPSLDHCDSLIIILLTRRPHDTLERFCREVSRGFPLIRK